MVKKRLDKNGDQPHQDRLSAATTHPCPAPGSSVLRGLPIKGHGITATERLAEAVDHPLKSSSSDIVGPADKEKPSGREIGGLSAWCAQNRSIAARVQWIGTPDLSS